MNRNVIAKALIAIALTAAVAAPASARQDRPQTPEMQPAAAVKLIRKNENAPRAYPGGNTAKAWTAACHAEFGEGATHPDKKLLQICLDY